jgi:hypothetical protein
LPDGRVMLTFLLQLRLRHEAAALASETSIMSPYLAFQL